MTLQNLVRYANADWSKAGTREPRTQREERGTLSLTCQPFRCAVESSGPSTTPYLSPLDKAVLPGTMVGLLLPVNLLPRLLAIADPDSIGHCEHEQRDGANSMSRLSLRVAAISRSFLARRPLASADGRFRGKVTAQLYIFR